MQSYHFTIVGGGLVGATTALALSQLGLSVCLIEAGDSPRKSAANEKPLDTPTIALSYASQQFFDLLGIWHDLVQSVVPITAVQMSNQGHFGCHYLTQNKKHYPALGYVVGINDLKKKLFQSLYDDARVTVHTNCRLSTAQLVKDSWICDLGDKGTLSTQLLISAEGIESTLRRQLRLSQTVTDYNHHALLANVELSGALNGLAVERFLKEGVIALLPWKHTMATLVYSLSEGQLKRYQNMTGGSIIQYCQQALGEQHGLIESIGKIVFVPLKMSLAQQHFVKQVIFLGNSVHSLHPIAAQGFNLSIRDIQRLYFQIKQSTCMTWGHALKDINQYVVACQRDQQKIVAATHGLAKTVDKIPGFFKSIGITGLTHMRPIKNQMTRLGMGLDV